MGSMDYKGVGIFLALALGGGYLLQAALLLPRILDPYAPNLFGYVGIVLLIIWPGIAAVLARQLAPVNASDEYRLWPLPAVNTLRAIVTVPVVYILANCVSWALGWNTPDWAMSKLIILIKQASAQPLPAEIEPMLPGVMLIGGLTFSILVGMTLYAAIFFCMEYGWRGYLLPKLAPLGGIHSLLIAAVLPALYAAPYFIYAHMVADEAMDDLPEALVRLLAVSLSTGLLFGVVWRRTQHLGLLAVLAGSIAAHMGGVWDMLFASGYWWFTGSTGLVICGFWLLLAAFPKLLLRAPKSA